VLLLAVAALAGNASKTFAFDGTSLWMVDHQNMQIIQTPAQGVPPAAVSFLTGGSSLGAQFNYNPDRESPIKPSWFQVNPASAPTYKLVVVGNGTGPATTTGSSASPMSTP
jgi:hypothetical protein